MAEIAGKAPRSLRRQLLRAIVPALVAVLIGALWLSTAQLRNLVDVAYDRSLAGALKSIDHNISTASGGLAMEQPYLLLEFFELTANGNVYFRVSTEDTLAEIGNPGLPMPKDALRSGEPVFFDDVYQGEPVRVAALARVMNPPLYNDAGGRVIVQVAESLDARQTFTNAILFRSIERDLFVIVFSVVLIVFGVVVAVRPLERLRQEVENRSADDLSPVSGSEVPAEVQPLVSAVNRHMARYEAQGALQSQFLDDASHQLRTPLSVLRTQVVYALREKDPEEARQALIAMQDGLDRAVRTTNQLLALARARDASIGSMLDTAGEMLDVCELCDGVVRSLLPVARLKAIDLGLDRPDAAVSIRGVEWLLREALVNLVDNAIRYSPRKGAVTVHIACTTRDVTVTVDDDGVGMSESDIARAGARFRRGTAGKNTTGAGLGLAIVRTIADAHGATLTFLPRAPHGLAVSLVFSLAPPRRAALRNENMEI